MDDEIEDPSKIEWMFFLALLKKLIKCKMCKQWNMTNMKYNIVRTTMGIDGSKEFKESI